MSSSSKCQMWKGCLLPLCCISDSLETNSNRRCDFPEIVFSFSLEPPYETSPDIETEPHSIELFASPIFGGLLQKCYPGRPRADSCTSAKSNTVTSPQFLIEALIRRRTRIRESDSDCGSGYLIASSHDI